MSRAARWLAPVVVAAAVPVLTPSAAHATVSCTIYATTGSWESPATWFTDAGLTTAAGHTPTSTDHPCWAHTATVTMSTGATQTVLSVLDAGHLVINAGGTLITTDNSTSSSVESFALSNASELLVGGYFEAKDDSSVDGSALASAVGNAAIDVDGNLSFTGAHDVVVNTGGSYDKLYINAALDAYDNLSGSSGPVFDANTVEVGLSGSVDHVGGDAKDLNFTQDLVLDRADTTIDTLLSSDGNAATVTIPSGHSLHVGGLELTSPLHISAGATLEMTANSRFSSDPDLVIDGTMTGASGVYYTEGRNISGTGSIQLPLTIDSNGALSAGHPGSAGTLTVKDLTLHQGSYLGVQIASPTAASQVVVTGTLDSDVEGGALITHIGGFVPSPQQTHRILACNGCTPRGANGGFTVASQDASNVTYTANAVSGGIDLVTSTPPSAPTLTGFDTVTTTSARALFTAPAATNGSTITGYTATCTPSCKATTVLSAGTLPLTGLSPGQTYKVVVRALSNRGTGAASAPLTVRTRALVSTPTVTGAIAEPAGLLVAFAPSTIVGGAITSYTVTCTQTSTGKATTASAVLSPVLVDGLVSNSAYTCSVHASTDAGDSAESPAVAGRPGQLPALTAKLTHKGKAATITGTATVGAQKAVGRTVQLTFTKKGSKTKKVLGKTTTDTKGRFTFHTTITKAGTYQVQLPVGNALATTKGLTVKAV